MNINRQHFRDLIPPACPTKIARVLYHLATGGSLNSIEAEKAPLFDHCLPSTIADLKKYGLEIIRTNDPVEDGYTCYSMNTEQPTMALAYDLLKGWGYRDSQMDLFRKQEGAR
tara:strand:+ start:195 stop:533 length:339 start_codon:yes stop_codon:yes gene_type:complete